VTGLGLGDQLRVGDIQLPPGVNVTNDVEDLIAMISIPRGLAEGEGEVAPEAAEGAEGEAAAGGAGEETPASE
jgi:hypothetical protein